MSAQYCIACNRAFNHCPHCNSPFTKCPYCKNEPSPWTCTPLRDTTPSEHTRILQCGHPYHFDCYIKWSMSNPGKMSDCWYTRCRTPELYFRNPYLCTHCSLRIGDTEYFSSAIVLKCGFQYHSRCWMLWKAGLQTESSDPPETFRGDETQATALPPGFSGDYLKKAVTQKQRILSSPMILNSSPVRPFQSPASVPRIQGHDPETFAAAESKSRQNVLAMLAQLKSSIPSPPPTISDREVYQPSNPSPNLLQPPGQTPRQSRLVLPSSLRNSIVLQYLGDSEIEFRDDEGGYSQSALSRNTYEQQPVQSYDVYQSQPRTESRYSNQSVQNQNSYPRENHAEAEQSQAVQTQFRSRPYPPSNYPSYDQAGSNHSHGNSHESDISGAQLNRYYNAEAEQPPNRQQAQSRIQVQNLQQTPSHHQLPNHRPPHEHRPSALHQPYYPPYDPRRERR